MIIKPWKLGLSPTIRKKLRIPRLIARAWGLDLK
jgi:hypothetical protein